MAQEVTGEGPMGPNLRATNLEARVGRLHARYRLSLEAKRRTPERGEVPHSAERGSLTAVGMLARLARATGLGKADLGEAPRVVHNTFAVTGLSPGLDGLTLAHVSDLHLDLCSTACTAGLAAAVAAQPSHALVITGDLFTSALTPARSDKALRALECMLDAHAGPAFAVLGDEDSLWMVPRMEQLGLRVLMNESVALDYAEHRLYVAGVDDPAYFKADDVTAALQSIPSGANSLLLAHSPEIYQRAANAGFDVMLSGHTHGGQLCLPSGHPLVSVCSAPPSVCRGPWEYESLVGYTSAGAGATPLKLRWNCPAEVAFHRFMARGDA